MIYYSIEKLVNAGITEILIVTGIEHCGSIIAQCGDGKDFNCNLTYKVQAEAGGIAQALLLAEQFVGNDTVCVILGDNIFKRNLFQDVLSFNKNYGAQIFLKKVDDPYRFGVAIGHKTSEMTKNQLLIQEIEEKPKNPKSDLAVTGIYMYDSSVFNKIKTIKPSTRGELEITDINNLYIKENKMIAIIMNDDEWWTDAGTFNSLQIANKLINI